MLVFLILLALKLEDNDVFSTAEMFIPLYLWDGTMLCMAGLIMVNDSEFAPMLVWTAVVGPMLTLSTFYVCCDECGVLGVD